MAKPTMDYYRYVIQSAAPLREVIIAFLGDLPFDTFEETETGLNAYLRKDDDVEAIEGQLSDIAGQLSFSYTRELIPHQNWNKVWESNFEPIQVGGFCGVRASFHPPMADVAHEIVIDPEMAFGTGHHETTFMMMHQMQGLSFEGGRVFDYGCGTGILAILAAMLGAEQVDAVDIERPAYESTLENASRNGVGATVHAFFGDLGAVPDNQYDIVLANINRNVILNSLRALYERLLPEGVLLASGILLTDKALVVENAESAGFQWLAEERKGDWACLKFKKA
ncbi:50S ribosomal protein L11 methyltransferase [Phaeodactylibacter luteus]|uniref:Ribosomal protein L11 methyltransferase n=2 Tax=Phaeodactylibacter luteus TaxID=1564516 RepID=A0A5C6RJ97_9BACT|nr:50S ribosomal protein L11 methyltransferase [Phaeodactylibacter luteus]